MNIPGIPDGIPRHRLLEMLASLGIDHKELIQLNICPYTDAINAELYATTENGDRYIGVDGQVATHKVAIPITKEPPA